MFGQVYNDLMRPGDPYEFMNLLADTGLLGVRRNRTTDEWTDREAELRTRREEVAATFPRGASPDPERDAIRYGQSAAAVDAVRPAADVIRSISAAAETIIRDRPEALLR